MVTNLPCDCDDLGASRIRMEVTEEGDYRGDWQCSLLFICSKEDEDARILAEIRS